MMKQGPGGFCCGRMAGESTDGMARLLRGPDQLPVSQAVQIPPAENVAARHAAAVADGPYQAGQAGQDRGRLLAADENPASMAGAAVCRQSPEVGAPCVSAHAGICAGGAGRPAFLPRRVSPPAVPAMSKGAPCTGSHGPRTARRRRLRLDEAEGEGETVRCRLPSRRAASMCGSAGRSAIRKRYVRSPSSARLAQCFSDFQAVPGLWRSNFPARLFGPRTTRFESHLFDHPSRAGGNSLGTLGAGYAAAPCRHGNAIHHRRGRGLPDAGPVGLESPDRVTVAYTAARAVMRYLVPCASR